MPGPTAPNDQHGIKADLALQKSRMAREPVVGGAGDARALSGRERGFGIGDRRAALDLDEGNTIAAGGDDVDLAVGRDVATSENAARLMNSSCSLWTIATGTLS